MSPDMPERERSPTPRRRWRPLDGPDRMNEMWSIHRPIMTDTEAYRDMQAEGTQIKIT